MKKYFILLLMAAAVLSVNAQSSLTNALTQYNGTSEDNFPAQPAFLAGSGFEASFVWDGGAGAWEKIGFNSAGVSFGSFHGGSDGRNYLRTTQTNFFAKSFTATVTVNRTARNEVFFGMGTAALGHDKAPDLWTPNASIYLDLQNGYDNAARFVNGSNGSGGDINTQIAYDTMSSNGVTTVTGLMQLKMVYDATAKTVAFSIDYGADGSYEQNFPAFDVSSQVTQMILGGRASIYFGSENGMVFSNFQATVVIPPVPPIGVILTNNVGVISYYGEALMFAAVVQTNGVTAGNASSNVVFSLGSTPVWTNAVVNGLAYYTNASLQAGSTNFTAQYLGDANYQPTNVTVAQTVLKTTPTPTVTAPPTATTAITYGQSLASSSIIGGSAVATNAYNGVYVPGTFAFANTGLSPNVGTTSVGVVFAPTDTTNYNNANVTNVVSVTVNPQVTSAGMWKSLPVISGETPDTAGWSTVPVSSQTNAQGTATAGWDIKNIKVCNDATNIYFLIELWPGSTNTLSGGIQNWFWINGKNNPSISGLVNPDGTGVVANDLMRVDGMSSGYVIQAFYFGLYPNYVPNAGLNWPSVDSGLYYEYSMSLAATNTDGVKVFNEKSVTIGLGSHTSNGTLQDMVPAFSYTLATAPLVTTNVFSSSPNPSGTGSNVTFTATIETNGVTATAATGTVQFQTNGVAFGSATLSSGVATLTTSVLPHGSNTVVAAYLGDANFVGSTNSLMQLVNTPPVATNVTYYRAKGFSLKIAITDLLTNVTDVEGDPISLSSVGAGLTNATIMSDSTYVYYLPTTGAGSNDNDIVSYTVTDGFGGTATANILINVHSAAGPAQMSVPISGVVNIQFFGIPNYTYVVQTATNPAGPWWPLSTNTAGANGVWQFTDPNATNAQQYYRSSQP